MSGSFEVVESHQLLSSFVFDVERRVVVGDGEAFTRDVVKHKGAVAIVPESPDGRIGLLRQYRATFDTEIWEIPAGTLDVAGETELAAAQRELREEIGGESSSWRKLGSFMVSPGWTDQIMHLYRATNVSVTQSKPEGPEEKAMTVHWLARDEIREIFKSGATMDYSLSMGLLLSLGVDFFV